MGKNLKLSKLFLASALSIFLELALIRWIAVEIRIFSYIKNLTLLLCFLGFGLGCALAGKKIRWAGPLTGLLGLFLLVRLPFGHRYLEGLSQALGAATDVQIWNTPITSQWAVFLAACALALVLFLIITVIFIPFGQIVSSQIDLAPGRLTAYSWNLLASLLGILAFFAASWASLPPTVWLGLGFVGIALLQPTLGKRLLVASLAIPAFFLLYEPETPTSYTVWTPYQQIGVQRELFSSGEWARTTVNVNRTGYQWIVDLSPAFLQRHPGLLTEQIDENPYNVAFQFAPQNAVALVVGAGTGNDVAAVLRNGGQFVDAVEIDPGILSLGAREHPEHPYSSEKVSIHITDARAFMKRTPRKYDLIIFGLLDSHTQLSDYANMRIDNFVYTAESIHEARNLLKPDGVLFVKFQVIHDWLGKRLDEMLTQEFRKSPVTFLSSSSYSTGGPCFAISQSNRVESALASNPRLARYVSSNRPSFLDSKQVPVTTDDWPYLYQEGRWVPRIYITVGILLILLVVGFCLRIPEARGQIPSPFFFFMGAGFLLLETQAISRLALYFGTTWKVNGIVIASLLTTLLLTNVLIDKGRIQWRPGWLAVGVVVSLVAAYLIPFGKLHGSTTFVGCVVALTFAVPVFFAGLLFATEFRSVESPSSALAANMLGAVCGGMLENLSLAYGMRALILVAALIYIAAALGLKRKRPQPA
jgi:Spermidine synthase